MKHFARYVILAPLATALAVPAAAQSIPPGQSCGGLFCDLGVVGHKVPVGSDGQSLPEPTARTASGQVVVVEPPDPHRLACRDWLCGAFGQRRVDQESPPAPEPVAAATPVAPETPAKPPHKTRRKHVAKSEAAVAQ